MSPAGTCGKYFEFGLGFVCTRICEDFEKKKVLRYMISIFKCGTRSFTRRSNALFSMKDSVSLKLYGICQIVRRYARTSI